MGFSFKGTGGAVKEMSRGAGFRTKFAIYHSLVDDKIRSFARPAGCNVSLVRRETRVAHDNRAIDRDALGIMDCGGIGMADPGTALGVGNLPGGKRHASTANGERQAGVAAVLFLYLRDGSGRAIDQAKVPIANMNFHAVSPGYRKVKNGPRPVGCVDCNILTRQPSSLPKFITHRSIERTRISVGFGKDDHTLLGVLVSMLAPKHYRLVDGRLLATCPM